jgi:ElaB/YqjD/DUF883 family membrane-anchored ribosome-binding protein
MATTDQVREKAQEGAQQARGRVRDQIDERSTQAGEQLANQAGDVRSVAEELRNQGKEAPAKIAEEAAGRVEKLGDYMKRADADRIMSDVEDFARSNPWAVAAGGLALGFMASRFLKASSESRAMSRSQGVPNGLSIGTGRTPGTGRFKEGDGHSELGRTEPESTAPPVPTSPRPAGRGPM